jgi:hypothetical protein
MTRLYGMQARAGGSGTSFRSRIVNRLGRVTETAPGSVIMNHRLIGSFIEDDTELIVSTSSVLAGLLVDKNMFMLVPVFMTVEREHSQDALVRAAKSLTHRVPIEPVTDLEAGPGPFQVVRDAGTLFS